MKSRSKIKAFAMQTEGAEVREALEASDWVLSHAAARLGIRFSSLQRVVSRHPDLQADLARYGRRQGRPPKAKT